MTLNRLLPTPRAEKHSPQSREDFTPNLAFRIQELNTQERSPLETTVSDQLTFSPAVSRNLASRSPAPDKEKAQAMTVSSGLRCLKSYAKLRQGGSWGRTFLDCLVRTGGWYSSACALTWKMKATKSSRLFFQLVAKTRPTDGTECGLLPTAHSSAHTGPGKHGMGGDNLQTRIAMLPTPATRDYRGENSLEHCTTNGTGRKHMDQLPNAIAHGTSTGMKLRLEPVMCEWMMGFPEGWTDIGQDD